MISFRHIIVASLLFAGITIDAQAGRSNHCRSEGARARRAADREAKRLARRGLLDILREHRLAQAVRTNETHNIQIRQNTNHKIDISQQEPRNWIRVWRAAKRAGIAAAATLGSWILYNSWQK